MNEWINKVAERKNLRRNDRKKKKMMMMMMMMTMKKTMSWRNEGDEERSGNCAIERGSEKNEKKKRKKSRPRRQRNRALFGRPVTCELSHTPRACLRGDEPVCACFFNQNGVCSTRHRVIRVEIHGNFCASPLTNTRIFYTRIDFIHLSFVSRFLKTASSDISQIIIYCLYVRRLLGFIVCFAIFKRLRALLMSQRFRN